MEPKKQEYKTQGNMGLFDDEQTLEKLNAMGNPIDQFREQLISRCFVRFWKRLCIKTR